ncbi:MAG TPA: hypothetical protein VMS98_03665 [Thermoanaerobaculia bacterium]|nr:hypothetical protein [Thermoanaerobaculia bacterium]
MDNRNRDKVNRPTDSESVNRPTDPEQDSSADFGQSSGRSEGLNNPDRESSESDVSSIGDTERSSPGGKQGGRSGRSEGEH